MARANAKTATTMLMAVPAIARMRTNRVNSAQLNGSESNANGKTRQTAMRAARLIAAVVASPTALSRGVSFAVYTTFVIALATTDRFTSAMTPAALSVTNGTARQPGWTLSRYS